MFPAGEQHLLSGAGTKEVGCAGERVGLDFGCMGQGEANEGPECQLRH